MIPHDGKCPLCGSLRRREGIPLQDNPRVILMECLDCHGISASRMPKNEVLEKYYAGYYECVPGGVAVDDPREFAKHLFTLLSLDQHGIRRDQTIKILDFGGGNGLISYFLAQHLLKAGLESAHITVIDLCHPIVTKNTEGIKIVTAPHIDQAEGKYHIVLASAVLEHIQFPREIILKLFEKVEPGGKIYIKTPYISPLIHLLNFFGIHMDFTYPIHLHDFGPAFLNNMPITFRIDGFQWIVSQPSLPETSFKKNFIRSACATLLKAPHRILGDRYPFVGGWEIAYTRYR